MSNVKQYLIHSGLNHSVSGALVFFFPCVEQRGQTLNINTLHILHSYTICSTRAELSFQAVSCGSVCWKSLNSCLHTMPDTKNQLFPPTPLPQIASFWPEGSHGRRGSPRFVLNHRLFWYVIVCITSSKKKRNNATDQREKKKDRIVYCWSELGSRSSVKSKFCLYLNIFPTGLKLSVVRDERSAGD